VIDPPTPVNVCSSGLGGIGVVVVGGASVVGGVVVVVVVSAVAGGSVAGGSVVTGVGRVVLAGVDEVDGTGGATPLSGAVVATVTPGFAAVVVAGAVVGSGGGDVVADEGVVPPLGGCGAPEVAVSAGTDADGTCGALGSGVPATLVGTTVVVVVVVDVVVGGGRVVVVVVVVVAPGRGANTVGSELAGRNARGSVPNPRSPKPIASTTTTTAVVVLRTIARRRLARPTRARTCA
jgi:hypothetical protein